MINSTVNLRELLFESNIFYEFGCCKVLVNDEIVWDDDVDFEHYVEFGDACEEYLAEHSDYIVTNIEINIVHFHHSIISITCANN